MTLDEWIQQVMIPSVKVREMPESLRNILETVSDEKPLLKFVEALIADRAQAAMLEEENPNASNWQK